MNSIFGVARKPKTCYSKDGVARKPKTCYSKGGVARKPKICYTKVGQLAYRESLWSASTDY